MENSWADARECVSAHDKIDCMYAGNEELKPTETVGTKTFLYREIAAPIVIGVFFCFLCFFFGVGQYPDSVTYIEAHLDREPVYPILLKGFRGLFGSGYLWATIIFQNMAAFFVTWYLHRYISRRFSLNGFFFWSALAVLLFPHIMSGVLAPSDIVLTNAILSEGITLTLYQLFFVLVLKMWLEHQYVRYAVFAWLVSFVTMLARGQMMPMILVWMLFVVILVCKKGKSSAWKVVGAVLVVVVTLGTFAGRSVIIGAYTETAFGVSGGNTGGNMTLLTNVLYSADEADVERVAERLDKGESELLCQLYLQAKEQGFTYASSERGVTAHILHHEDSHDRMKFGILYERMEQYVKEQNPKADAAQIRVLLDELAGKFFRPLVLENIGGFLNTYFYVICGGFVRTVAMLHPVLILYALVIYIVAIVLMWYLFRRKRSREAAVMMAMVLIMIVANVCATGLTIMCLSRYMIYNMAIFYVAGLVLLQKVWDLYKK